MAGALALIFTGVVQAGDTGAITGETGPVILVGAGILLTFVGVFVLARSIARPVLGALGAGARSMSTTIARENARRTPRRTAVTASALMVGVGLVATVAVLSQSIQDTIFDTIDETFTADLVVYASGFDPTAGFPTGVADEITPVEGVDVVSKTSYLTVGLPDGGNTLALGVEPDTITVSFGYDSIDGSLDDLGPNTFAVQQVEAEAKGWDLGQQVDFTIHGELYPAELVAIFDYSGELQDTSSYYFGYDVVAEYQDRPADGALSIRYEEGRDSEEMRTAIEDAISEYPTVQVQSSSDLADQVRTGLNAVVGLVAGLLVMSVAVAVVGIVLTLYLAVYERTRETGMLRAIGMTRKQIRKMIRFESILIAVFGTILGIGIGLFSGWALSVGVAGSGVSFGIPWVWVIAALVGALVTGVLAAIIPAYSATRMNVLEAIAYE
jgi:putative ABC transport system permease protein